MRVFILIIPLSIFLFSCSTFKETEKQVIVTGYDFTKYTEKGFLFTPEGYLEDYESVGMLSVEILPELKRSGYASPGQFYAPGNLWRYTPVSGSEVLDSLYIKAKRMGADAIINLVIRRTILQANNVSAPGIEASGFAIKRKDAIK